MRCPLSGSRADHAVIVHRRKLGGSRLFVFGHGIGWAKMLALRKEFR